MRKRLPALIAVAVVVVGLAGCGSNSDVSSSATADNTFVLGEFTIVPPRNTMRAGAVSITADNQGGEEHELVIVRAASAGALPRKADGSIDEDEIADAQRIGEIEGIAAGSQGTETFNLTEGRYVAFCNIVDSMNGSGAMTHDGDMGSGMGHVHVAEGMHASFTVG